MHNKNYNHIYFKYCQNEFQECKFFFQKLIADSHVNFHEIV